MIGFLHPWALLGLLGAAVPILLHLLARREPPTVVFPAVRYLVTTTKEHQRRLKLQNLLLLAVRTLLIIVLALAAAGPTMRVTGVPGHAPSALVLIVDNSPSSAAVVAGSARLGHLVSAGRQVLDRATPDDALWLITADGVPERGDAGTLTERLRDLKVSSRRLDLGAALTMASEILAPQSRPGEIVLLSDLQASAVSPTDVTTPLLVGRPADPPPPNVGLAQLETGTQPWSSEGGRVVVSLTGDSGAAVPVTTRIGRRPPVQTLAHTGGAAALAIPGVAAGWWTVEADLGPDEFRLDDRRLGIVRVAPVARATWDTSSRYIAAAGQVLASNRRVTSGDEVTFGRLARGASIVQPPEDAAEIGALNRALAARGVAWSYGAPSMQVAMTDSGPYLGRVRVLRRYQLQSTGSGRTGVLATVAGAPWLVRSGEVLLLGSRIDPAWTELPLSAGFMPFMDALINRLARGEVTLADGAPGDPVPLPDNATAVRQADREWPVESGGFFRPPEVGAYYVLTGGDTVGAITANLDPRESLLAPASDDQVRRLWQGARVADLAEAGGLAFSTGAVGDLRGPLLWAALALGLVELGLASVLRRQR